MVLFLDREVQPEANMVRRVPIGFLVGAKIEFSTGPWARKLASALAPVSAACDCPRTTWNLGTLDVVSACRCVECSDVLHIELHTITAITITSLQQHITFAPLRCQ